MNVSRLGSRRRWVAIAAVLGGLLLSVAGPAGPAAAATYVPITGSGSTMSATAIMGWTGSVQQFGMHVSYIPDGSSTGRAQFKQGLVDFAASDVPYGVQDGTNFDPPPSRGFAYIPDTAVGTAFMYNLMIGGQRVTNLRLSGDNIAKIFTGVLTQWNDPAIAADNPDLNLPAIPIVPVVRSDGDGSTAQFTQWMVATEAQYWSAYCAEVGRNPCTQTSAYPVLAGSNMVAQAGDVGVSGYVSQTATVGAIGYVAYPYALQTGFPVAKVLNAAGYYTTPTAGHVAVSLLKAKINTDQTSPNLYLTQDLVDVYANPDPRTYELSSYSYMVVPTDTSLGFTTAKGFALGDFGKYLLCQGQVQVDAEGYSALPINLVEAGFAQLQKIPGAQVPPTTTDLLQSCNNPTFSTDGTNTLAENDPQPQACDHQGPSQCAAVAIGNDQGQETINVNIPGPEPTLTVTVSETPVQLSPAALSDDATFFESTGQLGAVTVSDTRVQTKPGWTIGGQIGDFTSGANAFSGTALGWTPMVTAQNPAHDVTTGPVVAPGTDPGLKGGSNLAHAAPAHGLGTTALGADLDLQIPASTPPGAYSATLTITVLSTG